MLRSVAVSSPSLRLPRQQIMLPRNDIFGLDKVHIRRSEVNYRRFGRSGWMVGEIGYGMWGMGGWSGSHDEESLSSLQVAIDLGCNFFDTAWGYGDGHSESLLGQIVRGEPRIRNCSPPPRSRQRTLCGPAGENIASRIVSRPTISKSMCTRVWRMPGCSPLI